MEYSISSDLAAFLGLPSGSVRTIHTILYLLERRYAFLQLPTLFQGSMNRELAALLGISPFDVYCLSTHDWVRRHIVCKVRGV